MGMLNTAMLDAVAQRSGLLERLRPDIADDPRHPHLECDFELTFSRRTRGAGGPASYDYANFLFLNSINYSGGVQWSPGLGINNFPIATVSAGQLQVVYMMSHTLQSNWVTQMYEAQFSRNVVSDGPLYENSNSLFQVGSEADTTLVVSRTIPGVLRAPKASDLIYTITLNLVFSPMLEDIGLGGLFSAGVSSGRFLSDVTGEDILIPLVDFVDCRVSTPTPALSLATSDTMKWSATISYNNVLFHGLDSLEVK